MGELHRKLKLNLGSVLLKLFLEVIQTGSAMA